MTDLPNASGQFCIRPRCVAERDGATGLGPSARIPECSSGAGTQVRLGDADGSSSR